MAIAEQVPCKFADGTRARKGLLTAALWVPQAAREARRTDERMVMFFLHFLLSAAQVLPQ
jgi:hypothetical protein